MPNFERIEGKRKGSANFFHEDLLYKKSNADSFTRLRWRDGREGTGFIQDNHFYLNIE